MIFRENNDKISQRSDKPWQKTAGVLCLNKRSFALRWEPAAFGPRLLSKPHESFMVFPVLFFHKIVVATKL